MKKVLVIVLMMIPVLLTGCFQVKDISYTDIVNTTKENTGNQTGNKTNQSDVKGEAEFKFRTGQVTYLGESGIDDTDQKPNHNNSEGDVEEEGKTNIKTFFGSIEEFDQYIQELKKQSDSIIEIIDRPGYTKKDINEAIGKNTSLLEVVKKVQIPQTIIKTKDGRYYAEKYAKEDLGSIIVLRTELLECVGKSIVKTTKELDYKINLLQSGSIPNKEGAFNYARQGMMEEEGYVWDDTQKRYVPK